MGFIGAVELNTLNYSYRGLPYNDVSFYLASNGKSFYKGLPYIAAAYSAIGAAQKVLISLLFRDVTTIYCLVEAEPSYLWKEVSEVYVLIDGVWKLSS